MRARSGDALDRVKAPEAFANLVKLSRDVLPGRRRGKVVVTAGGQVICFG